MVMHKNIRLTPHDRHPFGSLQAGDGAELKLKNCMGRS